MPCSALLLVAVHSPPARGRTPSTVVRDDAPPPPDGRLGGGREREGETVGTRWRAGEPRREAKKQPSRRRGIFANDPPGSGSHLQISLMVQRRVTPKPYTSHFIDKICSCECLDWDMIDAAIQNKFDQLMNNCW
ncbi:hypothetical protein GQ55_3G459400 [Panicum hallii var. hallii]|uniref:Uncharacterized protein n=1 Tax=Panicum hallii var. hallii TaxID=1504633 RepID=A0A2T7EIV9_9POAL|nr:hypothetical protein GQ55_3G459400 [Panicum hallii var. hallii]